MPRQIISLNHNIMHESALKKRLKGAGFTFQDADYSFWRARKDKTTITFFKSGKLLIQGPDAEDVSQTLFDATRRYDGLEHIKDLQNWIGTDESGKGDFFGPLVVAAVYVTRHDLETQLIAELRDSKDVSDQSIQRFADLIKKNFKYSVITIVPHHYNELYPTFKNLNGLLGEAHAQAIQSILKKVKCTVVLSDKFGDESYIADALARKRIHVQLEQQIKAEKNPAVAAASILARQEFLNQLDDLSLKFGTLLPKGAGAGVIDAGKKIVDRYGHEALKEVAKLNFKTVLKIM